MLLKCFEFHCWLFVSSLKVVQGFVCECVVCAHTHMHKHTHPRIYMNIKEKCRDKLGAHMETLRGKNSFHRMHNEQSQMWWHVCD